MEIATQLRRREREELDPARAVVLPAPLITFGTGIFGVALGTAIIIMIAWLQVNPSVGIVVVTVLFTLALAGPRLLSKARTETGRTVALCMDSLAFGGVLGGLIVLLML